MKTILISLAFLILLVGNAKSQLAVDSTQNNVTQLVQNYFYGFGVIVSNVTFQGQVPLQIGMFTTGINPTNLSMSAGIILSSGNVMDAPGPNSSSGITTNTTSGSDIDLALLIPGYTVNDKAVLEFDFIPVADTLKFKWVFASEEYNEYVGSSFNDAFGFFLSGPGITGPYSNNAVNIALIPNTILPVTIDNVNNGANSQYYIDNDGIGGQSIEYDGFTVVIKSKYAVQHGMGYHIKLALGDAGDSSFDSALFLEASSLKSLPVLSETTSTLGNGKSVTNGCTDVLHTFSIPYPILIDIKLPFTISGNAVLNVDYSLSSDSIFIPAGDTSVTIAIHPLAGNNIEKTVNLTYNYFNEYTNSITTQFFNTAALDLGTDIILCQDENITLDAGSDFISYLWSTGATSQQLVVDSSIANLGLNNIWVNVSDASNCSKSDTVVIDFQNCTGLQNVNSENGITIFPNPAQDYINIISSKPWQINIYNLFGKMITTTNSSKINTIEFKTKGIYLLEFFNQNERFLKKVVME